MATGAIGIENLHDDKICRNISEGKCFRFGDAKIFSILWRSGGKEFILWEEVAKPGWPEGTGHRRTAVSGAEVEEKKKREQNPSS